MANNAFTQQALARSQNFIQRLTNALGTVAWQVINESGGTANHIERKAFARQILSNPPGFATTYAPWFVTRTNVFGFATSYDFAQGAVISAASDADLESQLSTDWNVLAGI